MATGEDFYTIVNTLVDYSSVLRSEWYLRHVFILGYLTQIHLMSKVNYETELVELFEVSKNQISFFHIDINGGTERAKIVSYQLGSWQNESTVDGPKFARRLSKSLDALYEHMGRLGDRQLISVKSTRDQCQVVTKLTFAICTTDLVVKIKKDLTSLTVPHVIFTKNFIYAETIKKFTAAVEYGSETFRKTVIQLIKTLTGDLFIENKNQSGYEAYIIGFMAAMSQQIKQPKPFLGSMWGLKPDLIYLTFIDPADDPDDLNWLIIQTLTKAEKTQNQNLRLQITTDCVKIPNTKTKLYTLKIDFDSIPTDARFVVQQRDYCTVSLAEAMHLYLKHLKADFTTSFISLYKTLYRAYTLYNTSSEMMRFLAGNMLTPINNKQISLIGYRSFFMTCFTTGLQYFLTVYLKNQDCVAIEIQTEIFSLDLPNSGDYVEIQCTLVAALKDKTFPFVSFQGAKKIAGYATRLNSSISQDTTDAAHQAKTLENCISEPVMRQNSALYKNVNEASSLLAGVTNFCGKMTHVANISKNLYQISNNLHEYYVLIQMDHSNLIDPLVHNFLQQNRLITKFKMINLAQVHKVAPFRKGLTEYERVPLQPVQNARLDAKKYPYEKMLVKQPDQKAQIPVNLDDSRLLTSNETNIFFTRPTLVASVNKNHINSLKQLARDLRQHLNFEPKFMWSRLADHSMLDAMMYRALLVQKNTIKVNTLPDESVSATMFYPTLLDSNSLTSTHSLVQLIFDIIDYFIPENCTSARISLLPFDFIDQTLFYREKITSIRRIETESMELIRLKNGQNFKTINMIRMDDTFHDVPTTETRSKRNTEQVTLSSYVEQNPAMWNSCIITLNLNSCFQSFNFVDDKGKMFSSQNSGKCTTYCEKSGKPIRIWTETDTIIKYDRKTFIIPSSLDELKNEIKEGTFRYVFNQANNKNFLLDLTKTSKSQHTIQGKYKLTDISNITIEHDKQKTTIQFRTKSNSNMTIITPKKINSKIFLSFITLNNYKIVVLPELDAIFAQSPSKLLRKEFQVAATLNRIVIHKNSISGEMSFYIPKSAVTVADDQQQKIIFIQQPLTANQTTIYNYATNVVFSATIDCKNDDHLLPSKCRSANTTVYQSQNNSMIISLRKMCWALKSRMMELKITLFKNTRNNLLFTFNAYNTTDRKTEYLSTLVLVPETVSKVANLVELETYMYLDVWQNQQVFLRPFKKHVSRRITQIILQPESSVRPLHFFISTLQPSTNIKYFKWVDSLIFQTVGSVRAENNVELTLVCVNFFTMTYAFPKIILEFSDAVFYFQRDVNIELTEVID